MNTQQKIEVMQALCDGKKVQLLYGGKWYDIHEEPAWNWQRATYRIKPEERQEDKDV